jgi:hypothetical protein
VTRPPTIRYLGFESTSEGRDYLLRVDGEGTPRRVTVTISNTAFLSRQARFQDAPELCFARLQRELALNADIADGLRLVVTLGEMEAFREAQLRRSPDRRVRTHRTWP